MNEAKINIRIDAKTKEKAENIFNKVGLNMTSAITLYLKKCINANGIPFDVTYEPNKTTKKAIKDVKNRKNLSKPFNNVKSLMRKI